MRDAPSIPIYLKDYSPPEYLVGAIELTFNLDADDTQVLTRLRLQKNSVSPNQNAPLELLGENLTLERVLLNERSLKPGDYTLTEHGLLVHTAPRVEVFHLETWVRINPSSNTALEGLYASSGMLCTQCEAEGFRRITFYPDRPDVMSRFTTTLIGDRERYPVLLSNGNPAATGTLKNNRHWARWEDPFAKPSYLFALVAGQLVYLEDHFITASGRKVTLRIYVEPHDLDKCDHAMDSLKHAMRWDEERFGREYDLDLYMIVAVGHFNMGAMENKGLNIFNTKFVLARPDTATDSDYENIEGVIGHEYFHNWTGNRITCRDWFQLSLKEGLTVFRDQEFSADRSSRAVKRIQDVNVLRTRQFAEDAGPLAHPVRPDSYIEINNFYTLTVYEKGAEVVRMLHTLLGAECFRRGIDLYFARHDGQAVTCDDFVKAMEDANGIDFGQFRLWYTQAGTPEVKLTGTYDPTKRRFALRAEQKCPPTPGQSEKAPMHIPFVLGLLDANGKSLPLKLLGEESATFPDTRVLELTQAEHTFEFEGIDGLPVVSAFRGFSAPVLCSIDESDHDLATLLAYDTDPFNRWDAAQKLATRAILTSRAACSAASALNALVDVYRGILSQSWDDLAYIALLLTLPSEAYLSLQVEVVDPAAIHAARQRVNDHLASELWSEWYQGYEANHRDESGAFDAGATGRRAFKNLCLGYLMSLHAEDAHGLALNQYTLAGNMTDQMAALTAIVNSTHPQRETCLADFYKRWANEALVVDKWFTVQATCRRPGTLAVVENLENHPAFDICNPNRVRALIGAFCQSNAAQFHAADGSGYAFLAQRVRVLDRINPQIAARMVTPLAPWRRYDPARGTLMQNELKGLIGGEAVSRDLFEVVSKSLE